MVHARDVGEGDGAHARGAAFDVGGGAAPEEEGLSFGGDDDVEGPPAKEARVPLHVQLSLRSNAVGEVERRERTDAVVEEAREVPVAFAAGGVERREPFQTPRLPVCARDEQGVGDVHVSADGGVVKGAKPLAVAPVRVRAVGEEELDHVQVPRRAGAVERSVPVHVGAVGRHACAQQLVHAAHVPRVGRVADECGHQSGAGGAERVVRGRRVHRVLCGG